MKIFNGKWQNDLWKPTSWLFRKKCPSVHRYQHIFSVKISTRPVSRDTCCNRFCKDLMCISIQFDSRFFLLQLKHVTDIWLLRKNVADFKYVYGSFEKNRMLIKIIIDLCKKNSFHGLLKMWACLKQNLKTRLSQRMLFTMPHGFFNCDPQNGHGHRDDTYC